MSKQKLVTIASLLFSLPTFAADKTFNMNCAPHGGAAIPLSFSVNPSPTWRDRTILTNAGVTYALTIGQVVVINGELLVTGALESKYQDGAGNQVTNFAVITEGKGIELGQVTAGSYEHISCDVVE